MHSVAYMCPSFLLLLANKRVHTGQSKIVVNLTLSGNFSYIFIIDYRCVVTALDIGLAPL